MAQTRLELKLDSYREEVPNVRRFVFSRADGEALPFVPGQFLMFHYDDDDGEFQRSYSLSSVAEHGEGIEVVISFVPGGRGCAALWKLEPGDSLAATGPYGRFTLRDEFPPRYIFVGTGTGIAPYRTMLPILEERMAEHGMTVDVLLGVRRPAELLFGADFRAFAERVDGARFRACYSREASLPNETDAETGYVTEALKAWEPDPGGDIVYLCGNPQMVDDAVAHLKELGFSPRNIRREKYISS
ncbi:MAG: ferredoxin-NADP reductase [Bradymonadia bacterium]|jgi:ferredoxin-NADP reductase